MHHVLNSVCISNVRMQKFSKQLYDYQSHVADGSLSAASLKKSV